VFNFIFNCGPFVFSENKSFNKKLRLLKARLSTEATRISTNLFNRSNSHDVIHPYVPKEKKNRILRPTAGYTHFGYAD
jgi:hypothetical protein